MDASWIAALRATSPKMPRGHTVSGTAPQATTCSGSRSCWPSGEIVELGGRTHKNVCGYDLVRLMVGSEGTLGVVTKARLKLLPLPPARASLVAAAGSPEAVQDLVVTLASSPYRPPSIELLDSACMMLLAEDHLARRLFGAILRRLVALPGPAG